MAFLRTTQAAEGTPVLQTARLFLRYPMLSDYAAWAAVRRESRDFLAPWEPSWSIDELSKPAFRRRLRRYARDVREDEAYPFFVFRSADEALIGGCILSNVRRGVSQSCAIGYWMGERFSRQGYMSEAVREVISYVFGTLTLHRIEAACLPNNEASIRLLLKAGFAEEGRARKYLKINGQWRDHLQFSLLDSDAS